VNRAGSGRIAVSGITFDFGNTLVRVDRAGLRAVVETTAARLRERGSIDDPAPFVAAWAQERDRQFRIQVPQLREVDLAERIVHVLAGLRGCPVPADDAEPWDDDAAATLVDDAEVAFAVETYSLAFVATMAPLADAEPALRRAHATGYRLGILSNWPLARTIDRYVEARGWERWLDVVVVSERVGVIKPHPAIFAAAATALGASPDRLIHVGDDWAADVAGARAAGWHVAYLRGHQGDTPLPTSAPDGAVTPDVELDRLAELDGHLTLAR
jgi:HAD superfamily hydrolase (TIGR01509 family)